MSVSDLEGCANYLESDKVNDRKKYCTKLSTLLDNKIVIKILSSEVVCMRLIHALQTCLRKDAEKVIEDARKKGGGTSALPAKSMASDLLFQVVKIAVKEDIEIKIRELVGYIIGCMNDSRMKKCYGIEFIDILRRHILSHPKSRGSLQEEDWSEIYNLLKNLIEESPEQLVISNCFMLIIKWGPTCGLSPIILREDFIFMTKFCQKVTQDSPRFLQEDTLEIAVDFCQHTAKDNRISCCKFGEDTILSLTCLYELNGKPEKVKELLVEFFLLQMIIHHPNGVTEGHGAAYAHNWNMWKRLLKSIYVLLSKEINLYFKSYQKNSSIFKDVGGGRMKLCKNFSKLFVEVSRQLFMYPDLDVTMTFDFLSPPQKRQKTELNLRTFIDCIQNKDWLWIHLVTSIIDTYPNSIGIEEYMFLLQVLSSIQIESNDHNVIDHLYICLSTMLDVEKHLDATPYQNEIKRLWSIIGATTTRAFGLNQHKDATEKLLEQLICKGIINFEDLLQTYQSGLISLSLQTIKTFDSGLRFTVLNNIKQKERIMRCILQSQNCKDYKYLCEEETARFLVKLTFKQYRSEEIEEDTNKMFFKYDNLKAIYMKTILDEDALMIKNNKKTENLVNAPDTDLESCILLMRVVEEFVNGGTETEEILFYKMILLVNICSWLTEYNIQPEEDLRESKFIHLLQSILSKNSIKEFSLCQKKSERDIIRLVEFIDIVNILFSLKISKWVMDKLKQLIPIEFLRTLFSFLNELQEDKKIKFLLFNTLKCSLTQALSNFACICGNNLNQNQEFVLEILSKPSYSYSMEDDYDLLTIFLKTVKLAEPGALPHSIMSNVLNCIQGLAEVRYQDKAEDILNIFCGVYPHIAASMDDENKLISVCFLKPFYENIENNGPNVTISLLECLQVLCELDPQYGFSRWSDVEVIKYVPAFLKSHYQEVRFKAIDVLVTYFKNNSNCNIIQDIHRQEEIFLKIYEQSLAVFDISGMITEQRRADEVLCRTSSVLLTFVNIVTTCDNWIEESLYYLMKISFVKGIEQIDRAFNVINKRMYGNRDCSILDKYVLYLVEKWLNDGYVFNDFQYRVFSCESKYAFYKKYFEECAHFLIMREQDDVARLAEKLGLSEKEIVERTSAKIFSRVICSDMDNLNSDILTKNKILARYSNIVKEVRLREVLKENLDQIVIGTLNFLTDEKYIQNHLGESVIFFTKHLDATEIHHIFRFIEDLLCEDKQLGLLLTDFQLPKLERVLLQLKLNLSESIVVKDQLKCFHRYAFFVNYITTFLNPTITWRYFFIRDVIHTLFNVIESNEYSNRMVSASCKCLGIFLEKILPDLSQTFKNFLQDTVNSLKKFYFNRKAVALNCKEILTFLIVKNLDEFKEEIKKLDTFPDIDDFGEIRFVQKKVRYGNREPQLEDEVIQFLNNQYMLTKEDCLVNLRKVLASQKDKLLEMYDRLQEIRGFSEDCDNSLLHRLVCALSQLCYSTNQKVSFEAARCLGELGPANLQTLVLQPEKILIHEKHSPFEIILGRVISLLSKYIIDGDMNVIKVASKIFYMVLNTKEGKKIVDGAGDFGFGPINKDYFIPYFSSKPPSTTQNPLVDTELFTNTITYDNLWCPSNITHSNWITTLVSAILETFSDKSILRKLSEVCHIKAEFSECLLPLVIDLLISIGHRNVTDIITKKLDYFFCQHWDLTKQVTNSDSIVLNKKSVKSMLNVVNYVRLMKKSNSFKSRSGTELTVDYLKVAKAAEFCANHFSALYYSELWCQKEVEKIQKENRTYCEKRSTMIDNIYENADPEFGETLHNLLRNAYKSVGDFDALSGCGTSFLLQPRYRVEHYKELNKFDQVIQFYANQPSSSKELIDSFKNYGLYQISVVFPQLEEPEYECLWRLSQWSSGEKKVSPSNNSINYEDFEKYRFCSLKAIHDENMYLFEESSKSQFLCIINHLKNISLESSHNLYPVLTKLQSLMEMEDFSTSSNTASLIEKWKLQDRLIRKNDFQYVEPIIAQRLVLLTDYLKNPDYQIYVKDYIVDLSLSFAGWAKDEGFCKEGLSILENLKRIPLLNIDTINKIDLLDAQLSWSVNNTVVARQILNNLCKNKDNMTPRLHSLALKLTGQYMSETYSENRTTIISDYFLASVKIMAPVKRDAEDIKSVMDTYDKLALFAHKEYQRIMTYMKSDLFQRKILNMEQAKKTAASIQKQRNRTNEERRAAAIHDRNSDIDDAEIRTARQESNQFLKIALKYYMLCLLHSDDKNIRIFQIMALFLENRKNEEIAETIQEYLPKIPSHKFIITLPQLIPHLSDKDTDLFSTKANEIIQKCALEHPHHTLPLLLSLANAYGDRDFDDSKTKTSTNDARVDTAKRLLNVLKKKGLADKINKLEQVSEALIDLAYYKGPDESNKRKKDFDIPRRQKIMAIRDFNDVLLPTYELPVSVTQNYSNIVGISSFKSSYQIVGGINKPKKILCRGTDGVWYSQLVKGHDDLRQDAVMQQVFTIMNNLLSYNKSTKHLRIRTYKIVPLSMRSGILKWADDSMPIGEYLIGSDDTLGAHQTYRPSDKLPSSCRESFKRCANQTADMKLKTYKDICKNFKPVLHHFFEYHFPHPAVWYERRRAYIHSVATTSMCGYILGIGDRHTSNILIDKTTAEVIHIDFGIAFEQGRVLPTPETVPFRLTRDMVDGMGISGVEGIFRRSCEKTMEVLRQNAQTINTILEVLLYDPLYAWTVTSAEANKRQTDSDNAVRPESSDIVEESTNVSAERALLRLREKLQGTELGYPRSIEHQVGTLIQQAVDPENLCKLFVGWQPYV